MTRTSFIPENIPPLSALCSYPSQIARITQIYYFISSYFVVKSGQKMREVIYSGKYPSALCPLPLAHIALDKTRYLKIYSRSALGL